MRLEALIGKIHRATVTQAELDYVGSITIDRTLAKAAGIRQFQKVTITNLRNGMLWYTYVMLGKAGSGVIRLNGPPARHFKKGDLVIILAYAQVRSKELDAISPAIVFVDKKNKITKVERHSKL